jgi:hypothetical protein
MADLIRIRIDTKVELSNSAFQARGRSCAIPQPRANSSDIVCACEGERRRVKPACPSGILDAFPTAVIELVRSIAKLKSELRGGGTKLLRQIRMPVPVNLPGSQLS